MAYGDITNSPNAYRSPSKPGVQTVRKAVLLKDGSTIGSAAVNYLSDTKTLEQLTSSGTASTTATKAVLHKNAGIYVGTAGNIMVNFSGDKDAVETGTATGTAVTNKLVDTNTDSPKKFTKTVQLRDLVVNTTDGTVAFVGAVDSDTRLSLVDVANSAVDIMAASEVYEIHRPIVFQNVAAGSFLPIEVDRVFAFATTADDIMAIY